MDPARIVVRVCVAYVLLLAFMRVTGKTSVRHAAPFDFVLAMVAGDLVDDAIWAEVEIAVFVVAAGALFLVHNVLDFARYRAGFSR